MGAYSLISVEVQLLRKATSIDSYQYYHLLSGQDMPIKNQDYIHHFFAINDGKEFVRFNTPDFRWTQRTSIFHLFQDKLGRRSNIIFNRVFLKCQELIGIKRNKQIAYYKGTQWFSITDAFARYIVDQGHWVEYTFRYTYCCDEVFVQTLLMRSPYSNNRYWMPMDNDSHAIMRLIDWNRGAPYTFRMSDFDEIKNSDILFCRKFDANVDDTIIHQILERYS